MLHKIIKKKNPLSTRIILLHRRNRLLMEAMSRFQTCQFKGHFTWKETFSRTCLLRRARPTFYRGSWVVLGRCQTSSLFLRRNRQLLLLCLLVALLSCIWRPREKRHQTGETPQSLERRHCNMFTPQL